MDLQFKCIPFEMKASEGDGSVGRGLGSAFYNIDSYGEIVDNEAFNQDLPDFLENGFIGGINHMWDMPIGRPTAAKAVDAGLQVEWKLSPTAHGKDVMILLKDDVIKKLSIGFSTLGRKVLETFDEVKAYWEEKGYTPNSEDVSRAQFGATVLTRIRLYEISPVVVPANSLAVITAVKAAREAAIKVFENQSDLTEPENERLTSIRSIASRSHAEDILRNAGFSCTERAAFISAVKSLPRNAASDDAEPDASTKGEVAPDAAADITEPETEEATEATVEAVETAGDTPVEDAQPDTDAEGEHAVDGEAIVTEPVAPDTPEETRPEKAVPLTEHQLRLSRAIAQRQALLDAKIELAFSHFAGR